jgi:hypothetical protein
MEQVNIKLHSITDLITNSSTTIYTYSDESDAACIEMIDEILKSLGSDKTCKDMFRVSVNVDRYVIVDYFNSLEEDDKNLPDGWVDFNRDQKYNFVLNMLDDIANGKINKPEILKRIENEQNYDGMYPQTYLTIVALKPEYAEAAVKIKKFLYSTAHEA